MVVVRQAYTLGAAGPVSLDDSVTHSVVAAVIALTQVMASVLLTAVPHATHCRDATHVCLYKLLDNGGVSCSHVDGQKRGTIQCVQGFHQVALSAVLGQTAQHVGVEDNQHVNLCVSFPSLRRAGLLFRILVSGYTAESCSYVL